MTKKTLDTGLRRYGGDWNAVVNQSMLSVRLDSLVREGMTASMGVIDGLNIAASTGTAGCGRRS